MFLLHMIFIRIERNNQERHRSKPLDSNHQDQPLAIFTPFWKRNHQDRLMKRCSSYKLIRLVNLNFEHRFGSEKKKTDFLEWNQVITMFIFFLKTEKENLLFPSSFYSREEPLSTKNKSSTEILKTIIDKKKKKKFIFFLPRNTKSTHSIYYYTDKFE